MQPDLEDVAQVLPDPVNEPPVNVVVDGPVRTQALPRRAGATFTKPVGSAAPTFILRADGRRAAAYITSFDQDMLVAFSNASAQDASRMGRWPAGTPLPVEAATDVWVQAVTGTSAVSVITEMWATGDGRV